MFGIAFVGLGMFSLLGAILQYNRILKHLDSASYYYHKRLNLPLVVGVVVVLIGIFSFIALALI